MSLRDQSIVVGMTGGIAAYKAVELVRELGRRGAKIRVVMSRSATRFVGPITLTGLIGESPIVDLWDPAYKGEVHIELGEWADAMIVAPATMQFIASAAHGFADDPVLATYASMRGPRFIAPAMHTRMYERAATQRNLALLGEEGVGIIGPVEGPLASGEIGLGRMSEPAEIADAIERALGSSEDLRGKRLLISAGPTYEDLDPVRFLGNRSTGKMGYALASRAAARGAKVVLVSGPTTLPSPPCVETLRVRSAVEMHAAIMERRAEADAIIMTAAIADYRPESIADHKIKKSGDLTIKLTRNPDILRELGEARASTKEKRPALIGFALETRDVEASARAKLKKKGVDLIVGNEAADGFGGETNRVVLVDAEGAEALPLLSKREVADRILDRLSALIGE